MARGKGKYGPKSKILVVLKSAHHKFLENALSKLIFSKVENGTPYCRYLHKHCIVAKWLDYFRKRQIVQ